MAIRGKIKALMRFLKIGGLLRRARMAGYALYDFFIGSVFRIFIKKEPFDESQVKKILIVRLDRLGDIVLSTPAMRAVRQKFPLARIDLLVSAYASDIVQGNPHVDRVLVCSKDALDKDYDLAISLQPGFKRNKLLFSCGARWRAGYRGWGGGFYLTHSVYDDRSIRIRHEVESALEIVGLFGCRTADKSLDISVSPEAEMFAECFYRESQLKAPVVIIHPGARQEYIRWAKGGYAEVADRLVSQMRASVVITGSEAESGLVREVAALMKQKAVLATGLSLPRLVALIKKGSLFIGNSTGPMHIAAALKIPVVAIFGCRHPLDSCSEWGPWADRCAVVSSDPGCRHCHPSDCPDFACMKAVSADDVYHAAQRLL